MFGAVVSSHTALNQKRKISDSIAFAAYVECLYTPYSFLVMHIGKERKKERRRRTKQIFLRMILSTLTKVSGSLEALSTIE